MTASGLSSKYLWDIGPENILVVDDNLNVIEGEGRVTREINMHMKSLRHDKVKTDPCPPKGVNGLCLHGYRYAVVSEALEYLGETIPVYPRPATTQELAELVGKWTSEFSKEFKEKEVVMEDIYAYGALKKTQGNCSIRQSTLSQ